VFFAKPSRNLDDNPDCRWSFVLMASAIGFCLGSGKSRCLHLQQQSNSLPLTAFAMPTRIRNCVLQITSLGFSIGSRSVATLGSRSVSNGLKRFAHFPFRNPLSHTSILRPDSLKREEALK
jgi:hypothetical protein